MAFGVQRPLQLQHVRILLGVDVLVWKIDQQAIHTDPGDGEETWD